MVKKHNRRIDFASIVRGKRAERQFNDNLRFGRLPRRGNSGFQNNFLLFAFKAP